MHQKDQTLAEQWLRELMSIDPSCPEVLQLAEILLQKGPPFLKYLPAIFKIVFTFFFSDLPNYSEIQEILSGFLEYPHNSDEPKALELLTAALNGK